jgi:hypothetical protein
VISACDEFIEWTAAEIGGSQADAFLKRTAHVRFPQTRLDSITVFKFVAEPADGSASPTASGAQSCAQWINACLQGR